MRALAALFFVGALAAPLAARADIFAYVSCADSAEIDVFSLDLRTGAATPVQKMPVPGSVMPMTISPDHHHLYAAIRSKPYVIDVLTIDPKTGKLTDMETQPIVESMAYISLDRTGRTLFGASYGGNLISTNHVDAKGSVDPQPVQVITTPPMAHAILPDFTNHYVLATILGGDAIQQYKFDPATSKITPNTPPQIDTAKGAGPRFLTFSVDHRFVYATNELAGTVDVYSFDPARGVLTAVQNIRATADDFQGTPATADLHVTPDGRFLYVSERTSNTIIGFRTDRATGKLTLIGRTPTETQPRGFGIDPRGRFLLAVGQKSNAMTIYAIDRTSGSLKSVQHLDTGKNPNWIEFLDTSQ